MNERPPWDVPLPVGALRSVSFPMLVVSGEHDSVLEMRCDTLATAIGRRAERAVIPGRGHVVQRTEQTPDLDGQHPAPVAAPRSGR